MLDIEIVVLQVEHLVDAHAGPDHHGDDRADRLGTRRQQSRDLLGVRSHSNWGVFSSKRFTPWTGFSSTHCMVPNHSNADDSVPIVAFTVAGETSRT